MRTSRHILISLSIALSLLSGCGGGHKKVMPEAEPVVSVKVLRMEQTSDTQVRSYVGEARSSLSVVLSAPYSGTLEKVAVRVGDKVAVGKVVAKINSQSVRNSYDVSQALLRQAEDGYARVKKVHKGGGVPDIKLVEVETELAKARAAAQSAKHALAECAVKSPFAGTVSDVFQHQGAQVSIATPLLRVVDEKSVEIIFPVPESEYNSVDAGGSALVDIPALGLKDILATVISKGVEADKLSHTYDCSLFLNSSVPGLMPGMVCKVRLTGNSQNGYIVPAELVQTDSNGRYVWLVNDGEVEKRYVDVGAFLGTGVVVSRGINDGDKVISEGFQKVSTGMKVNVME